MKICQAITLISYAFLLHLVPLLAIERILHAGASALPVEKRIEAISHPKIIKNTLSTPERIKFTEGLNKYAEIGERHIAEFKRTGSSDIDYGDFFISFEYYAQHLAENSYLMPQESRDELLAAHRSDLRTSGNIVRSNLYWDEKLPELAKLVHSKSTPDDDANTVPSLMVPEGGHNCFSGERYELSLAVPFALELLFPDERFVSARYNRHVELGVYNKRKKTLYFAKEPRTVYKEWTADLYDPMVEVQLDIDIVLKGGIKSKENYAPFLVAAANKVGTIAALVPGGDSNPLPLNQGGVSSPYSYSQNDMWAVSQTQLPRASSNNSGKITQPPPGQAYDGTEGKNEVKVRRQPPSPELAARIKAKVIRRLEPRRPLGPIEFDVIQIEPYRWHMDLGEKAWEVGDYIAADQEYAKALGSDYETIKAHMRIMLHLAGDPAGTKRVILWARDLLFRKNDIDNKDRVEIENGKIVGLDLGYFGRERENISALSGLTHLRRLKLLGWSIKDLSPLAKLTDLEELDIEGANNEDISPLAGMKKMKKLYMQNVPVKDLSPLSGMTELEELGIGYTGVRDLSPIAGLIKLKGIWMYATKIGDISPLAGMTQLEVLSMFNTLVSDLSPLAGKKHLSYIGFCGTRVRFLSPLITTTNLSDIGLPETIGKDEIGRFKASHPNTKIYDSCGG